MALLIAHNGPACAATGTRSLRKKMRYGRVVVPAAARNAAIFATSF